LWNKIIFVFIVVIFMYVQSGKWEYCSDVTSLTIIPTFR
jgi:hypothetical protein